MNVQEILDQMQENDIISITPFNMLFKDYYALKHFMGDRVFSPLCKIIFSTSSAEYNIAIGRILVEYRRDFCLTVCTGSVLLDRNITDFPDEASVSLETLLDYEKFKKEVERIVTI